MANSSAAERITPEGSERRLNPRFETDLKVELLASTERNIPEPLQARAMNISSSGIRILIWHDPQVGTDLSLKVFHNGYDSFFVGSVVWKRETTAGMLLGLHIKQWTYLDPVLKLAICSLEARARSHDAPLLRLHSLD